MMAHRTKRLTQDRALKILQLRYGTQIQSVLVKDSLYIADSICGNETLFSRADILAFEDEMYSALGA